ncbi:MAG: molybdate ABC transporter substrate-binding protein [Candidatus Brocadiia bacterium]
MASCPRRKSRSAPALAGVLVLALGACSPPAFQAGSRPLRVFAPWCMEKRLRRVVELFQEKRPATPVRFTTGTPGQLIKRLRAGERPDVYVAMGPAEFEAIEWMGLAGAHEPKEILRQTLLLAVRAEATDTVRELRDLAKQQVHAVGLGRATLTSGRRGRAALRRLGILEAVAAKARPSPLRRLVLGEVHAAVLYEQCCYQEDLHVGELALRRDIAFARPLPRELCEPFPVLAAALGHEGAHPHAAVFVQTLRTRRAQDILARRGEWSCPVCEMEP